jgi:RNA polymerase sigma-70 factor (ECF subfamily)
MSNREAPASLPVALAGRKSSQAKCESIEDIESLVVAYLPYVRRLALTILNDQGEADDAAQATFLAICRTWAGFRGNANLKTWLTAITVNVCRGRLRKRKVRARLQAAVEALHINRGREVTPEEATLQNEAERRIWQAVANLHERHRLAVMLYYVNELTADEIAQALGASEGTVYSRLHYARQNLRLLLDDKNPHAEENDGTP